MIQIFIVSPLSFFRILIATTLLFSITIVSKAQTGSFSVGGDFDKFYPVTFSDGGYDQNSASELELARSEVHTNSSWRGSFVANFRYHTNRWGNASDFINADIKQIQNGSGYSNVAFVAGFADATKGNYDDKIIIWLRGGGTTYYYRSKFAIFIKVYDGVANPLPFQEINHITHTFKTVVDTYVNTNGMTHTGSAYFYGSNSNYFNGSIGIGVKDTKGYKLAVAGSVIAESIKVQNQGNWPDYVFDKSYVLTPLDVVKRQIDLLGHLPEMPSTAEVNSGGINIGEMNLKLLKKIEELTLHLINQDQEISTLKKEIKLMNNK